jgi:hypothetical protein
MSAKFGGSGSSGPSGPTNARGTAPGGSEGSISGVPASKRTPAEIDQDALGALMDSINQDPKSLQLVLLAPMRDQLEELENDPENNYQDDPAFQMLSKAVGMMVDEQQRRLDGFAAEELDNFYSAVSAASEPRQSMIEDERQYRALSRLRESKRYANDAPDRDIQDQERIQAHTTRTRTTTYAARLGDMIYPTNDYPIRFEAPNDPDPNQYPGYAAAAQAAAAKANQAAAADYQQQLQAFQAQQQGQPQPGAQPPPQPQPITPEQALDIKEYAANAASAFQEWAFECFDRMHLRRKGRELLENGAKVGCGLWYGPFPEVSRKRVPRTKPNALSAGIQQGLQDQAEDATQEQQAPASAPGEEDHTELDVVVEETFVPGLEVRDPFRFFYDMTPTLEESNATYYLHTWTLRQLSVFKEYPNVIVGTVEKMLEEDEPKIEGKCAEALNARTEGSGMSEPLKDRWAVIEGDRIIKPDKLEELLGIKWDSPDLPLVKIWLNTQGQCLKIKLTPLEHDWRPPYYNFGIMPKDDTIYWYSVPSMGRAAQKGIDGALNATLWNASLSVAPFLVFNKGQIQPHNERWRVNGMVAFSNLNPDIPAKNAISSIPIDSNVEGNLQLFERFLELFDDDVMFDQVAGGDMAGEEISAAQLAMMVNLRSIWQRRMAGYVDDYVMGPFGERMVWWGTMYWKECGGSIDMVGPHVVKPIAATQMVSKDILIQHCQAFAQLSNNPRYAGFVDDYKEFKVNASLLSVPDLMDAVFDRATATANNAKIRQGQTSPDAVKMADVQRQADRDKAEDERERMRLVMEAQTVIKKMQTDLEIQASKERVAMVELMTTKQVDMQEIQVDLAKIGVDADTKKQLATLDATLSARLETLKIFADKAGGASPYSKED